MSENTGCTEEQEGRSLSFEERAHIIRRDVKGVTAEVDVFLKNAKTQVYRSDQNVGEILANITLAKRHLESAAMRIGKSMQAYQGGVSILDKMTDAEFAEISARACKPPLVYGETSGKIDPGTTCDTCGNTESNNVGDIDAPGLGMSKD